MTELAPREVESKAPKKRRPVPRAAHAVWERAPGREDPVSVLQRSDAGRLPQLIPLRYSRMQSSPFAFFRGAAPIMAADLATTPVSGIESQICGDAHLLNFGAYASPERRLVFDVNDFDETIVGPWEWDLKRLAASVAIAGRHLELRRSCIDKAVRACVRTYRERMTEYAGMRVLDVWYARLDESKLADIVRAASPHPAPKVDVIGEAARAIVDRPPLVFHPDDRAAFLTEIGTLVAAYRRTLTLACHSLLDRFELVDAAYKVVGVGSVGTRCLVALFAAGDDTLLLQAKEARASVLEPYAHGRRFADAGERVVSGQRAMQAVSDIFLGWARDDDGHDFYFRQAHDMKTSADIDHMNADSLRRYVAFCGWALARAHAKASGKAVQIASYLGRGEQFDDALLAFAHAYADQNERDYATLLEAIAAGRVRIETPKNGSTTVDP